MPIAETVVILANTIATARDPLTQWETSLYEALIQLPRFRDVMEIDEWERLFREAWRKGAENADGYFSTSRLLEQVFELGRYNLYTAFNSSATCGQLNTLVRELNVHHDICAPDHLDVSEW
ncbi:MAG: hypothetical protein COA78_10870 [Blastopirellula sp.]|nr:MAG: hypothetical protein COA78_10870 [Blastopirellula sp.]